MLSLFKSKTDLYPWYGKQPILEFIKAHIDHQGNLTKEGEELPDTTEFYSGKIIALGCRCYGWSTNPSHEWLRPTRQNSNATN